MTQSQTLETPGPELLAERLDSDCLEPDIATLCKRIAFFFFFFPASERPRAAGPLLPVVLGNASPGHGLEATVRKSEKLIVPVKGLCGVHRSIQARFWQGSCEPLINIRH